MRVVVAGSIATGATAGNAWCILNYIHGFLELGYDVCYVEDSYVEPFYSARVWRRDGNASGRRILADALSTCTQTVPYCYHTYWDDRYYGLDREQLTDALRRADLLVVYDTDNPLREGLPRPKKTVAIDGTPALKQMWLAHDPSYYRKYLDSYDAVATVGELIGTPGCPVPTLGLKWIPTRHPVCLSRWPTAPPTPSPVFTTLTSWSFSAGQFRLGDRLYRQGKDINWVGVVDLPRRVPWVMDIAIDTTGAWLTGSRGMPLDAQQLFRDRGWRISSPVVPSSGTADYASYIRSAAGEFAVAKEQFVALEAGWFGDRSALFLASGRPVVTQETGFSKILPTGEGLFAFADVEQAAAALNRIASDYPRHARSARRIAEEYFDAGRILRHLVERVA